MRKTLTNLKKGLLTALFISFGWLLSSFNSQEHKIIGDVGVSRVKFPGSIIFPNGIGFYNNYQANYLSGWQAAKIMAVGFATNNPNDFSDSRKNVQDNCYWYRFGQLDYNKKNYIEPTSAFPNGPLLYVSNFVGNQQQPFTFGDLVALYGDFRRTVTYNDQGVAYMTTGESTDNVFSLGNRSGYCPPTTTTYQYQKNIAFGLWPPFGSWGNVSGNTAKENQYNEAAWWGDEMMRLANVNDTHFSNGAIAWYIGMHRLALIALRQAATDPSYWNKAINFEASALHTLTDLFAFGHVVTNRDQSAYGTMKNDGLLGANPYLWMENSINMGGGTRPNPPGDNYPGKIYLSGNLPPLSLPFDNTNQNDFMPSYLGTWASWANAEHTYHDYFNDKGATVRNFNGDRFQVYGDAKLHNLDVASRRVIENAVTASVQSFIDAFAQIKNGVNIEDIAKAGTPYFKALKYIPVFVEKDPDTYFSGMWTLYAGAVRTIAGAGNMPGNWQNCRIPFLSGADWGWPSKHAPCTSFQ